MGGLSDHLFECKYLPLPDSGLEEGLNLMTPDSVLEPAGSNRTSSGSGHAAGAVDCRALACTATTEIVRKKRSATGHGGGSGNRPSCRTGCTPVSEITVGLMNRRKGTPHRAPLYWIHVYGQTKMGEGRIRNNLERESEGFLILGKRERERKRNQIDKSFGYFIFLFGLCCLFI